MKLTTKSTYGIRALINLAVRYDDGRPVSIKEISDEESIPCIYLEQIFNRLKKQDLIKSVRGAKGGYILARSPKEISVLEVVRALENMGHPATCVSHRKDKNSVCERSMQCASREVWDEVEKQISITLDSFSLQSLACRALEVDPEKRERIKIYEKSLS